MSIALALAGGAAIATPLILQSKNSGGGSKPVDVTTFTVTFNVGKGLDNKTATVKKGEKVLQPSIPITEGQQVNNWKKEDGSYWNFDSDVVTSNITLAAEWTDVPPTSYCTVTFMADGKEYAKQAVVSGQKVVEPKSPTKSGYDFVWWHETGKSTAFNFNTPITADLTLEARFDEVTVITHKVTFFAGDSGTFAGGSLKEERSYSDDPYFFEINKPTVIANDGFTHLGWKDADGNDLDKVQITKDIEAHAYYMVEEKYVGLTLDTQNDAGVSEVEVLGTNSFSWKQSEAKKYKDIKKGLSVAKCASDDDHTYAFTNWSATKQTAIGTQNPEPDDATPIGEGAGKINILYPQFKATPKVQTVTLKINLADGQRIRSGSDTIEVPYQAEENKINKKFGEVTKPEVYKDGEVFEGYYKDADYKTAWKANEPITPAGNKDIWVKTVSSDQRARVNFAVEDTVAKYTWVGNHEDIRCDSGTKLSDIAIPNVYKDATEDPDPTIGFATNYVFTNWYYKDKSGKDVDITDLSSYTIKNSVTLFAKFEKKTKVTVQINEATPTPGTEWFLELPSAKWENIVKPNFTTSDPSTRFLVGWQYQNSDDEWIEMQSSTKISDIKLTSAAGADKEAATILPIISDKVHNITFIDKAKVEGEADPIDVYLKGSTETHVDRTKKTSINYSVNKPILPPNEGKTLKNEGITFDNKWQIKSVDGGTTFADWTDVTDTTSLPKSDTPENFQMRPVVTRNITLTYDANSQGAIVGKDSVSTGTSKAFSDIYKPSVTPNDPDSKVFSHWAKKVGDTYVKVLPTDKFTENTTLYAIYNDLDVFSTIHYKVAQADIDDPDFPAQPIDEDNCFEVTKAHKPTDKVTVEEFADRMPTKKKHHFLSWGTYNDEGELEAIDPTTEVTAGEPLVLYAMFEPDATAYHKVTIKEDTSKYWITGDASFYIADGATMPINDITNDIELEKDDSGKVTSSVFAWTVGKVLTGWQDSQGNAITSETKVEGDLLDIVPVFAEPTPTQPMIKFIADLPGAAPSGAVIGDSTPRFIPINDTLSNYLAGQVQGWAAPTATKAKSTFDKWKIVGPKNAEGEYTLLDITSDTRVTRDVLADNTLTLIATFIDESIYEGIDGAYFYDEEKKQWAAIQSYFTQYGSDSLTVKYQDGEVGYVEKGTFNYEIKFGSQTTSIPDYFMYGCSNWNNGGKTLKFPSNIKSIGKNVMAGCSSFNQAIEANITPLDLSQYGGNPTFTIGENFMKNCYLFDNDITIKYVPGLEGSIGYFAISEGFMAECQSLGKTATKSINLTGWTGIAYRNPMSGEVNFNASSSSYNTCLSTLMTNPYTIKLAVSNAALASFKAALPDLASATIPYHRSISWQ